MPFQPYKGKLTVQVVLNMINNARVKPDDDHVNLVNNGLPLFGVGKLNSSESDVMVSCTLLNVFDLVN